MLPILYSNASSYYSMITRLAFAEKNIAYDLHNIDIHIKMEQFSPEYVSIQPNMTVPALVYEDRVITSSREIMIFINTNFAGVNLCRAEDESKVEELLDLHYGFSIEDLTMGTAMRKSPVARFALGRGLQKASKRCVELMTAQPKFTQVCKNKIELEKLRERSILSKTNNYDEVKQRTIALCDILEENLIKHEFIAGNNYSLADVVWTVFLARLMMIKFDNLILSRPHLASYWQRMQQRDSFAQANLWTKMRPWFMIKVIFALIFKA